MPEQSPHDAQSPLVATTCPTCLKGKHIGCQGCACNICVSETPRLRRPRRPAGEHRRPQRDPSRPRRKPGGPGQPKGTSTLPAPMRAAIEAALLVDGLSLRECARRAGCSRDKVRTIQQRWQTEEA